jgi:diadenylate cyclase
MWTFIKDHWRDGLEILILAVAIYQIYKAIRATRGARILVGMVVLLVSLMLVLSFAELKVINWLVTRGSLGLLISTPVIFQPEIRNALAKLGSSRLFNFSNNRRIAFLESLDDAVVMLSRKRIGALFAIERDISLRQHLDTGVPLDATFTPELAITVFFPKTPLHDGGMVIADDRVAAAACVFPVSHRELSDRSIGLRHRAAIGLTEETDAVAVIVSEETGAISICTEGILERNLGEEKFRARMAEIFLSTPLKTHEKGHKKELAAEDRSSSDGDSDLVSD